jgi:3-dehydroquinate dehydratase-2
LSRARSRSLRYVEIHISNIATRNIHCVLSDCAVGMMTGFGLHGYVLALEAMLHILEQDDARLRG